MEVRSDVLGPGHLAALAVIAVASGALGRGGIGLVVGEDAFAIGELVLAGLGLAARQAGRIGDPVEDGEERQRRDDDDAQRLQAHRLRRVPRIGSAGAMRDLVGVPGVKGGGADGRAGLLLAGVHHVLAVGSDGGWEAVHATWCGSCPLFAEDGVLASMAEALEPVALLA